MNGPIVIIFIAVVVLIRVYGFFFSKKAIVKRKLKNAAQKKISQFRNGDVAKITGKIKTIGAPLTAPLSKRKCARFYVHIEESRSSGDSSYWKTLIEEDRSTKFLIQDGSAYAMVNAKNLKSYIVQDRNYSSGFLNDASDVLEAYLRRHDLNSEGFFGFNKSIRYNEGILEDGETVAVFGKGKWVDAKTLNLPEKYGKVLEVTSNDQKPAYISDDPETSRFS